MLKSVYNNTFMHPIRSMADNAELYIYDCLNIICILRLQGAVSSTWVEGEARIPAFLKCEVESHSLALNLNY